MNLFLLGMTGIVRHKSYWKRSLFAAAFLGSVESTILAGILFQCRGHIWEGVLRAAEIFFAIVIVWQMLQMTFHETAASEKWKNLWAMFQCSVVTGGAVLLLREQLERLLPSSGAAWMLGLGLGGVFLVVWWEERICNSRQRQQHILDGELEDEGGEVYHIRALFDTGNQLVSPYTGERVAIISQELARKMMLPERQKPLWIPFHSVGGDGLLPAYRLRCLTLSDGQRRENLLAAVSECLCTDRAVQMILSVK